MLPITIPATEQWDEYKQEFISTKEQTLQLEHSLVSLSKWESKWCKPFLSKGDRTYEETIDYIRCMTITQNVKPETYYCLTKQNLDDIEKYINAPMTATCFPKDGKSGSKGETITSELIYYWMSVLNINIKCEKWHLNRLIAFIRVCSIKNQPPKKMGKRETINQYAALNAARRKQMNSRG